MTSPPIEMHPQIQKYAINSAVFKEIAPDPTDVPNAFATSFAPIPCHDETKNTGQDNNCFYSNDAIEFMN